jgi:dihydroxyacetone kinase DhaKLM complex PTS-EIIA-like component DhaM
MLPLVIIVASASSRLATQIQKLVSPSIAMVRIELFIGVSDNQIKGTVVHSAFNLFSLLWLR